MDLGGLLRRDVDVLVEAHLDEKIDDVGASGGRVGELVLDEAKFGLERRDTDVQRSDGVVLHVDGLFGVRVCLLLVCLKCA
jgi:hypothetical protein